MAQLTQADFLAELKLRGWSRFNDNDVSLTRYLNWGLQEVYRRAKFPNVRDAVATDTLASGGYLLTFAELAAASDLDIETTANEDNAGSGIHSINAVYVQRGSEDAISLNEASREMFRDTIFPNQLSSDPDIGLPTRYYVHAEQLWLWPMADQDYVWTVHMTARADFFADEDAFSGLPERMDSAILAATEVECCKRSKDLVGLEVAMGILNGLINQEVANENQQFTEEAPRIGRYMH